ncbi:MAG: AMP-binding protein [Clostridiales bacterium]|nr:AMP-binding protein [Clostridiales bacterium]
MPDLSSSDIRRRIRDLRHIHNFTKEYMAGILSISAEDYSAFENGEHELNYAFLYTCSQVFNVDINELIEGAVPNLSSYSVNRGGDTGTVSRANGMTVHNLASKFRNRMVEPLIVTVEYDPEKENLPIEVSSHIGQEFDYILSGSLKIRIGEHTEVLNAGDTIFYDSSAPHGMIASGGKDCVFLAAMVSPEDIDFSKARTQVPVLTATRETGRRRVWEDFVSPKESGSGVLESIFFKNSDRFNFAFDIVDRIADTEPDKTALVHLDEGLTERRFTFKDIKKKSGRAANYLASLGIKKGDRVMLVLRRSYHFWIIITALQKIGAVAVPVIDQLLEKDYLYRFRAAGISAVIACGDSFITGQIDSAASRYGRSLIKIAAGSAPDGWYDFDTEYDRMSARFLRSRDSACGSDPLMMIFQSYSDGMPKATCFDCRYPLAHFVTGYYWNCNEPDTLSFCLSDTAWAKALWGKLFGPWICESGVFAYDFRKIKPSDLLKLIERYRIASFTAPGSMFRALLHEDLKSFDLSSLKHVCSVGDNLSAEVFNHFRKETGLSIMTGYGLTETSLLLGSFIGMTPKAGAVGKVNPIFDIRLLDTELNEVETGEPGEICISISQGMPIGLMTGYYNSPDSNAKVFAGGYFHTGDLAWKDEDGYFWPIGRVDDVIKCSGYRIGPYEVESVIMELPYVKECGVSAVPDEIRGQVVKASVVLIDDKEPSDDLKEEIQNYVKTHTAAYRYPRIVEFRSELPKTANGTVIRSKL